MAEAMPNAKQWEVVSLSTSKVINQKAFANSLGIPMGAVVNLMPSEEKGGICQLQKEPLTCARCGAFLNPFCTLETQAGRWKCNFCQNGNVAGAQQGETDLQLCPELTRTTVDYVNELPGTTPMNRLPQLQALVFVLDLTFSPEVLHLMKESIKRAVRKMDESVLVGLVLVDTCVSLVNLDGQSGIVEMHCVPGHTVNMPPSLRRPLGGFKSCLRPLKDCMENFTFALDNVSTTKAELSERLRPRCFGTGIHEALMIIKETRAMDDGHVRRERVVLMTCGPPNRGPGSIPPDCNEGQHRYREAKKDSQEFFGRLADVCTGLNVKVDLYGVSFSPTGLSLIEILPKATFGIVSYHSVITPELMATQILQSIHRTFGSGGILDVRLSRGLRLTSVVGPVSERLASDEAGMRKLTNNACRLRTVDSGQSLCLLIEATADFGREDLYIQIYLSWKDSRDGSLVERVVTCPISPTGNLKEFLKAIHATTAGVLLSKKVVLECTDFVKKNDKGQLANMRNGLAYKLAFMVQKFGKLLECKDSGFFGFRQDKKWGCPQELWYVAQCLYHLHRGPLLGQPGTDAEEVKFLQTIFLSAPLESADRMIVPRLFTVDAAAKTLVEVAAVTTALSSEHVMLVDHGFYIFIWIGKKVVEEKGEEFVRPLVGLCEAYAVEKCMKRGTMPELIALREGVDDQSIYQHLTPSCRDSAEDQAAQMYSAIKGAAIADSEQEQQSLPDSDELSFYEWCRMVNAEPPKLNKEMIFHALR